MGAAQGLVLAGGLAVRKRGSVGTNRTLAALVFCLSLFVLGAVSTTMRFYLAYPHASFAHDPFVFLCTPLLFLYLSAFLTKRPLAWRDRWHFVPAAALFVGLLPYYLLSAAAKLEYRVSFAQAALLDRRCTRPRSVSVERVSSSNWT